MLARDALASVGGFKMLLMVTYAYLFGMRVRFPPVATTMTEQADIDMHCTHSIGGTDANGATPCSDE